MVLSLVASVRGLALMPAYVEALLPWSVVSRPLEGEPLTIDLAIGYRPDNDSPASINSSLQGRLGHVVPGDERYRLPQGVMG